MDQEVQNMIDKFKSLKCSICNFVLSVPPVMTISKDGNTYKCGRCKHIPDKDVAVRCILFETMAETMTFPCSYENCKETIPWKDAFSHEKKCAHRTMKCPIYYQNCQENVQIVDLESHMLKNHKFNVHYEKMSVDFTIGLELTNNLNYVCLLITNEHRFLVYVLMNEVLVLTLEPSINKDYLYSLELSSTTDDYPKLIYKYSHIKEFDEKFDCSECFNRQCHLPHHPCSTLHSKKNTYKRRLAFDKKKIENIFGKSRISFRLYVELKKGLQTSSEKKPDVDCASKDYNIDIIRRNLECPLCNEYMVQQIYTCITGHVFCNKCRSLLKGCPTCQASILNTRNFALENIAEIASLTCIYEKSGCDFFGNLEAISTHEVDCSFAKIQ